MEIIESLILPSVVVTRNPVPSNEELLQSNLGVDLDLATSQIYRNTLDSNISVLFGYIMYYDLRNMTLTILYVIVHQLNNLSNNLTISTHWSTFKS